MRLFAAIFFGLVTSAAGAATVSTSVSVGSGTCGSSSSLDGPGGGVSDACGASAYFGNNLRELGSANGVASARAGFGSIGVAAQSIVVTPQNPGGDIHWESLANASFSDTIATSIGSGSIRVRLDLGGSFGPDLTGFPSTYQSLALISGYLLSGSSSLGFGGGLDFFGVAGTDQRGIFDFDMPIINGYSTIYASLSARAACGAAVIGDGDTVCNSSVSFYTSMRFIGASVFDDQGVFVSDAIMTSDSGFDYATGVEPHISPVPLPAAGLLLVLSIGCLGAFRRVSRMSAV